MPAWLTFSTEHPASLTFYAGHARRDAHHAPAAATAMQAYIFPDTPVGTIFIDGRNTKSRENADKVTADSQFGPTDFREIGIKIESHGNLGASLIWPDREAVVY